TDFFYNERDQLTRESATIVLERVQQAFGPFSSVVDVGCGVGTWLDVASKLGATSIKGFEGEWIKDNPSKVIPEDCLEIIDLEENWQLKGKYSLGICLEVAEHLTAAAGNQLVNNLCDSCELVLFSAAIPNQGGKGHINEQWPTYWQYLFKGKGFVAVDCIRPAIWDNEQIPWWYRQNCVVFCNENRFAHYISRLMTNAIDLTPPLLSVRLPGQERTIIRPINPCPN